LPVDENVVRRQLDRGAGGTGTPGGQGGSHVAAVEPEPRRGETQDPFEGAYFPVRRPEAIVLLQGSRDSGKGLFQVERRERLERRDPTEHRREVSIFERLSVTRCSNEGLAEGQRASRVQPLEIGSR